MEDKIRSILAAVLEIEPGRIDGGFGPERCAEWDSLGSLRLITALEKEFAVKLSWAEIGAMTDFSRICQVIGRRIAPGAGGSR